MKRTAIKKLGKVGMANREARKMIADIAQEKGLTYCEIMGEGCLGSMYLAPAHRHKRAWYKGDANLLADYKQWVSACQVCHDNMEHDAELTEKMFKQLRGDE